MTALEAVDVAVLRGLMRERASEMKLACRRRPVPAMSATTIRAVADAWAEILLADLERTPPCL
ncbi:MAG: hypothetical protein ACREKH_06960 [Candidatus Rokuibacteriota bacterium]